MSKLDVLISTNPELYDAYMDVIDHAIGEYCYRNRCSKDIVACKIAEPDDMLFGGTRDVYKQTYTAGVEELAFNSYGNCNRMPVMMEGLVLGWYCDVKADGWLSVRIEGVVKKKDRIMDVYSNRSPPHYLFSSSVIHIRENDKVEFVIYIDGLKDFVGEIYPIVVLIGSARQFWCNSFNPNKLQIQNRDANSSKIIAELKKILIEKQINQTVRALETVMMKDEDGNENPELKPRLDPDYQEWLECLKDGEVCQFCGSRITRKQVYCHFCGVPINKLETALEENNEP